MKKFFLFNTRFFTSGALLSLFIWQACSSPRLSQVNQQKAIKELAAAQAGLSDYQATPNDAVFVASNLPHSGQEVAAASSRPAVVTSASTREVNDANKTLHNYAAALKKESQAKKGAGKKLAALPAKMALKSAIRKIEKAEKRLDITKTKNGKAAKAMDPTIRTGIIIAAVGLLLIIIAGVTASGGLIYSLGGIALTVGLVVILLAALDVI